MPATVQLVKSAGPIIKFIGRDRDIGRQVRRSTPRWHFGWFWRVGRERHVSTHLPRASDEGRGISRMGHRNLTLTPRASIEIILGSRHVSAKLYFLPFPIEL